MPAAAHACDAGVLWGANCTQAKADAVPIDPACNGWPLGANATSTSTTLIWKKGGAGYGGVDNKVRRRAFCPSYVLVSAPPSSLLTQGGDVFLSTFVSYGCSSGYYGAQMHWNTMKMSLDWAMWDSGGGHNKDGSPMPMTHPINPTDPQGRPTDRKGHLCSTHEPPPKGFVQCPCSRYSGEGFGTQCGLTAADEYLWEIGTPFTLNISLTSKNSSGATFRSTITNMKTKELIEVGQIYTTSPDMSKQDCSTMPMGGGSFQEYYDGGNL